MSYDNYNKIKNYFWIILVPLSYIYSLVVILRRKYLQNKIAFSNLKILCVGNIHSGGSGKTPIVMEIAKKLQSKKLIILSKGYKGKFLKDLEKVDSDPQKGPVYYGDEPWMMSQQCNVPVYVTRNRKNALKYFDENFPGYIVILDDGFQDVRVKKDFSVVVVNGNKNLEDVFCLPYGEMREPLSTLKYADTIILTNPQEGWLKLLSIKARGSSLFKAVKKMDVPNEKVSCVAFCGIGHPQSFYQDVEKRYQISHFVAFSDHYSYKDEDVQNLLKKVHEVKATCLVTTEKDYAKVKAFFKGSNLHILKMEYEIEQGFFNLLTKTLE